MAQQVTLTVYKIDTDLIIPVKSLPFPAGTSVFAPVTDDNPALTPYVKSSVHFQDLGRYRQAYVTETVAAIVTAANA